MDLNRCVLISYDLNLLLLIVAYVADFN